MKQLDVDSFPICSARDPAGGDIGYEFGLLPVHFPG
jgi:hypothetical protein